jgi:hypothetical protein
MARWAMILTEYNYSIQYIKGKLNEMGDSLSRLVAMPPTDWESLPSDERDSDDHHPFLNIWPDLNLLVLKMDTFTADISTHVSKSASTLMMHQYKKKLVLEYRRTFKLYHV